MCDVFLTIEEQALDACRKRQREGPKAKWTT